MWSALEVVITQYLEHYISAIIIIIITILFIWWRKLKQGLTVLFGHVMLLDPVPSSHDTNGIVNSYIFLLCQDDWNKMQRDIFGHMLSMLASHDHQVKVIKWGATWHLLMWHQ